MSTKSTRPTKPTGSANLEATGYSRDHSFTEAFRDAVHKLEMAMGGPQNHLRVSVKEIGGEYGGAVGANSLFVTVRKGGLV
jgi:hypothetical protein